MFKLRRLYVDTIGVPDNRFVDLCADATDLAGEPCDTIVWLRNGAGKTTMLSLLLALILPDRRDFLAFRTKRRTLEDLVGGQDTAHVVAEWVDPRGQRLLTGAIYQWEGRTKPRDHNGEGKNRLKRYWWCLHPDDSIDGATFETLPTTSRTTGAVDLDRFAAHVGDLAARGVNATGTDRVGEWHDALRQRRFDPDLFRYFAEVNATEGGIDALFTRIDSPGAFVRYLLRFVAEDRRITPVRDLLRDTAVEIAKQPIYGAERAFCAEAQPLVAAVGEAHAKVAATATHRERVRTEAAAFKRALLDAANASDGEAEAARRCRDNLEGQRLEMRNRTDAARRQRDEYRRLAAVFRHDAAKAAVDTARRHADAARLEADAWAAVSDLVAVIEGTAKLDAHRAALRAAAQEAAPALAAAEAAQARLAGSLDHHLSEVAGQLDALTNAATATTRAKGVAETSRRTAITDQARLDAERGQHARSLERVDARQRRLIEQAVIEPGERLSAAVDRLHTAAARHRAMITRIKASTDQATAERKDVRAKLPEARRAATETARAYEALAGEAARLDAAAAELAAASRLRDLVQADDVDPIAEAHDLLAAIAAAVAAADAAALDMRAEGADDERAIAGLEADGVLPPRPAVILVVDALSTAGFAAQPGWRYIAAHHASEAASIIARMPEVADGVVVYGDPHAAARALDGLAVADPVVIAPATVFSQSGVERVVVGPSPARHDPAAGATELALRHKRASTRRQLLDSLAADRRRDEELAARLRQLLRQIPADGIDGLAAHTTAAATSASDAAEALTELVRRDDALDDELTRLGGEEDTQRRHLARIEAAQTAVQVAVEEEREMAGPARARLEALPDLLRAATEAEQDAEAAIADAEAALEAHRGHRVELETSQREWATERSALGPAMPNTEPLEACRGALRVAEAALREQFPEVELRRNVDMAVEALAPLTQRYQTHVAAVRERAEAVLDRDAAAQDPALRAAAARRARDAAERAQQRLGAARRELEEADAEVAANTPADRPRHAQEVPAEPADRDDALRHAAAAAEEAAALQLEVGRLERERDQAGEDARTWTTRAGMLQDQADKLPGVEPAEMAAGDVDTDDDQVRRDVAALADRLEGAEGNHAAALSARSQRADVLRTWAQQDRFAKVADDEHGIAVRQLRDLFRGDNLIDRVALRASELTEDLATRERAITQQIAQVETHKRNVVVRLADLVDKALADLSRASTLSELPAEIGPWAGQQFLAVAPRTRPTLEQVQLRVGELVDRTVTAGKVDLDPVELLWRATESAVTDGFRASVLKPAPDQPPGRTAVEDMRKWSGGENLTASLVLFCVLAKLRAENRTGTKAGAIGGVVPLDNPLGKANYLPFLELQRKVAAVNGVQLLFWTGIGDLAAVGAFPRIAAMRKKPAASRPGVAYVVADTDASATTADATQLVEHLGAVRAERPA
jgi:hypothetical protein